jgi:rod shape determining protein RodA
MKNIFFHLKKLEKSLLLIPILISLFGLIEIWSASRDNFLNFKKQFFFLILGVFLMILISFFDWRILKENSLLILGLYFLSVFLLILALFFGPTIRGVKGWFKIGPFSFEPIELTKFSLLVLFSRYFSLRHIELYSIKHILISAFYVFLPAIFVFLQPDFGSFLILISLWVFILIFSGIKLRHFLLLILIGILIFTFSFEKILKPYQKERILTFLKLRISDPLTISWSQNQAKIAIGSGGIFGKGIGKGSQTQLGFLPEPQTDFIFSVICEETGFLGAFFLFFLYSLLFFKILKMSFSSISNFEKLFSGGFLAILFSQIFLHLGSNLSLLPVVGIPLPFVSYGGSNLLLNFLILGILQSIKIHGR